MHFHHLLHVRYNLNGLVKLADGVYIHLEIYNKDSVLLTFEVILYINKKSSPGWLSFGLGNSGMINMDVIVVEFQNKSYKLFDKWSKTYGLPSCDTDLGGKYDLTDEKFTLSSNGVYSVSFKRKLNTGDKFDNIIEKV